ncbi:hypothetical protein KIPB_007909 [Kipferlia bialata]|uniref:Uncharacterized protein n=1 Tax=Kipferlia bialata TaxID=797122 RepID=A0A9K3D2I6_9EUKA|nr:hypothetical protein KIPB_007909 [Kipferlia bialata]|eukprot:g7909.t1
MCDSEEALLAWIKTFPCGQGVGSLSDLVDGVDLFRILSEVDESQFPPEYLDDDDCMGALGECLTVVFESNGVVDENGDAPDLASIMGSSRYDCDPANATRLVAAAISLIDVTGEVTSHIFNLGPEEQAVVMDDIDRVMSGSLFASGARGTATAEDTMRQQYYESDNEASEMSGSDIEDMRAPMPSQPSQAFGVGEGAEPAETSQQGREVVVDDTMRSAREAERERELAEIREERDRLLQAVHESHAVSQALDAERTRRIEAEAKVQALSREATLHTQEREERRENDTPNGGEVPKQLQAALTSAQTDRDEYKTRVELLERKVKEFQDHSDSVKGVALVEAQSGDRVIQALTQEVTKLKEAAAAAAEATETQVQAALSSAREEAAERERALQEEGQVAVESLTKERDEALATLHRERERDPDAEKEAMFGALRQAEREREEREAERERERQGERAAAEEAAAARLREAELEAERRQERQREVDREAERERVVRGMMSAVHGVGEQRLRGAHIHALYEAHMESARWERQAGGTAWLHRMTKATARLPFGPI